MTRLIVLTVVSFSFLFHSCNHTTNKDKTTPTYTNINASHSFKKGKVVYEDFCVSCHLPNGEGVPKIFPPLANSDYLMNKRIESIKAIKYGLSGEIEVNGETYNSVMLSQGLSDSEIADVMNYITNSWGNKNTSLITEEEVSKIEP
nr:cytochrome c [uncultured Psychroserpens sp.]